MRPLFVLLLCPALLLAGEIHSYTTGPATPLTPGFHKLVCEFTDATIQPTRLPFTLYLPSGYGTPGKRFPMVTFLGGLGDRGDDPGIAMCVGVPLEIGRDPDLRAWMPMIVLTPQCPSDRVWETPGMPQRVLELIDTISKQFQVDASRLYLTGFSNGGLGCWALAAEASDRFALIAPIVSREFHAQATAQKLASSPTTFLIISGTKDPKSEPASANMGRRPARKERRCRLRPGGERRALHLVRLLPRTRVLRVPPPTPARPQTRHAANRRASRKPLRLAPASHDR